MVTLTLVLLNMDECPRYLVQNLADVPVGEDWLSQKEQALNCSMHFAKRRNDWRLGRWTAKQAYRLYQSDRTLSMREIDVVASEDGGPDIFIGIDPAPVSISISHSHDRGFCAIAPDKLSVGCDLEWMEYESPGFFDDYFRAEEMRLCREAPAPVKPFAEYLIWSAKESCLKVLREGLRRDTRSVSIEVDFKVETGSWNTWSGQCIETASIFHGWWRHEDRFVYTVAANRPIHVPEKLLY